ALGATTTTKIEIDGNLTIVGGRIQLAGPSSNFDKIVSGSLSATLNLDGVFLDGAGVIGNSGLTLNIASGTTVHADQTSGILAISGTIINAGTMEGTNSAPLVLRSGITSNGTIIVDDHARVLIDGTITASGILEPGTNSLVHVTGSASMVNNVDSFGSP